MRRAFCFSRSWSRYSLLADATAAVLARRVRPALDRALHRVALGALEEQLHPLAPAEPADGTGVTRHVRPSAAWAGGSRCAGSGVTSLMPTTSMPVFWIERIAVSRPEPGPFTSTSTLRTPCSIARRAHCSAASCAANGVLLREPLKPTLPADAHARMLPSLVGDRDDRVVERRLDVRDAVGDVLALAACGAGVRPAWASPSALLPTCGPSSCRRRSSSGPCGCGRWCGCAARGPGGPAVAEALVAADLHLALDVLRRSRGAGHPRP